MGRKKGKRRMLGLLPPEPPYSGPIAVLLFGEGHDMSKSQVIKYIVSMLDDMKDLRNKNKRGKK